MFITILPAGRVERFSAAGMVRFFPVVGLLIGLLLAGVDVAASRLWGRAVASLIDVVFLAAVTGAFHLDGLGDSADGLFSHRSRERALEIMKDSRTGMMGLVAVVLVLLLKTAGIYSLKSTAGTWQTLLVLVIVPAYARAGMIAGMRFLDYGRKDGTGRDFFKRRPGAAAFAWVLFPIVLSLPLGVRGLVVNLLFLLSVFLILLFYRHKIGCITGDMLGAMCEVTETLLFLAAGMRIF